VIKTVPAYNKALKKTGDQLYDDLSAAEKTAVDNAVTASKKFDLSWKGAMVSSSRPRSQNDSSTNSR
jgi:hypothetical protein